MSNVEGQYIIISNHPSVIIFDLIESPPQCSTMLIIHTIILTTVYFFNIIIYQKPAQWTICSFSEPGGDTSIMEGMAAGESHQAV